MTARQTSRLSPESQDRGWRNRVPPHDRGGRSRDFRFRARAAAHDLLFLPRDIAEPKVLAAWIKEIERGAMTSLHRGEGRPCHWLRRAWSATRCPGRPMSAKFAWSCRGRRAGLASVGLVAGNVSAALEAKLEKIVAQMTVDQTGAIALFEGLAFARKRSFATMSAIGQGRKHDIVLLGHNVAEVRAPSARPSGLRRKRARWPKWRRVSRSRITIS